MSRIAFVFPGQGAQYVGMGKDFYDNFDVCKEVFETAGNVTGLDIKKICFEENEQINITEYTQIAMLTVEVALMKVLEEKGIKPEVTAGLSLGEYGALVTAGVLSTEDAFKVIRQRGILMQEAVPTGGAMAAVLGMDNEVIAKICEETAVDTACETLKENGAKRCVKLNVSGPFHSAMLKEAGEKLLQVLNEVTISDIKVPYLTNVTADYVADKEAVKDLLKQQVYSSVKWQQSVEKMIADGIDTFIEIGPGKTLAGFMRKIDKEKKVTMLNLEKQEDLEKIMETVLG